MPYDYEYLKREVYDLTRIDLNAYKEKQMKRRIDTLIAKHHIVGYDKYIQVSFIVTRISGRLWMKRLFRL